MKILVGCFVKINSLNLKFKWKPKDLEYQSNFDQEKKVGGLCYLTSRLAVKLL